MCKRVKDRPHISNSTLETIGCTAGKNDSASLTGLALVEIGLSSACGRRSSLGSASDNRKVSPSAMSPGNDSYRIQFVGAEVISDFPEGYTNDETALSVDDGEPEMLDFWAFIRAKQ